MRILALPALLAVALCGCSGTAHTLRQPPPTSPSTRATTTTRTHALVTVPGGPDPSTTIVASTTVVSSTTSTPTASDPPTTTSVASQSPGTSVARRDDPVTTATQFLRAALDADAAGLGALTHPAYRETAQTLWITAAGPSGQTILATKLLDNAAGHARVAVFVDAGDVVLAALPYVVELIQDPTDGRWLVTDAGLETS